MRRWAGIVLLWAAWTNPHSAWTANDTGGAADYTCIARVQGPGREIAIAARSSLRDSSQLLPESSARLTLPEGCRPGDSWLIWTGALNCTNQPGRFVHFTNSLGETKAIRAEHLQILVHQDTLYYLGYAQVTQAVSGGGSYAVADIEADPVYFSQNNPRYRLAAWTLITAYQTPESAAQNNIEIGVCLASTNSNKIVLNLAPVNPSEVMRWTFIGRPPVEAASLFSGNYQRLAQDTLEYQWPHEDWMKFLPCQPKVEKPMAAGAGDLPLCTVVIRQEKQKTLKDVLDKIEIALQTQDNAAAVEALAIAAGLEATDDVELGRLIHLAQQCGRLELAQAVVQKRAQRPHASAAACFFMGELCAWQLNWEKALAWYLRAAALGPDNNEYWEALADAYQQNGDEDNAFKTRLKILELEPDSARARINLAKLYLKRREKAKAEICLLEILEYNLGDKAVWQEIAGLGLLTEELKRAADY